MSTNASENVSERNNTVPQRNSITSTTLPGAGWNLVRILPPLSGVLAQLRLRPGTLPNLPDEVWSSISRRAGPTFNVDYVFHPRDLQNIVMDMAQALAALGLGIPIRRIFYDDLFTGNVTTLANLLNLHIVVSRSDMAEFATNSSQRPLERPPVELLGIINDINANVDGVSTELSEIRHSLVSLHRKPEHEKCL